MQPCSATRRRPWQPTLGVLSSLLFCGATIASAALIPPPWADPTINPCASQPRGWQLLYWPADGKCYKIFQIGAPCPETMELGPSAVGNETRAECRCPPGTAQSPRDALCHPIFTRASCPKGQYFAPVPEPVGRPSSSAKKRWGVCRESEPCPSTDDVFWPRDGKCYPRHSRGPCPRGELLILDRDNGLASCSCSREGELGKFYAPVSAGCYEHFTKGPCQEPGELFLPGGKCGCRADMPQYYPPTGMCYQLGGPGPCPAGHHFVLSQTANNASGPKEEEEDVSRAGCSCKPNYVRYEDGLCYRTYTQGPCQPGDMLVNATSCVPVPCRRGRLYFPRERTCYRTGTRGPCSHGRVVIYDYSARPSIDGISYNGVCGCTSSLKSSGCRENDGAAAAAVAASAVTITAAAAAAATATNSTLLSSSCEDKPGVVMMNNGTCYKLYTRGPCEEGEWLVARRMPRTAELADVQLPKARCECKPGYTRTSELESNSLLLASGKCQAPVVKIAKFLNENARAARF